MEPLKHRDFVKIRDTKSEGRTAVFFFFWLSNNSKTFKRSNQHLLEQESQGHGMTFRGTLWGSITQCDANRSGIIALFVPAVLPYKSGILKKVVRLVRFFNFSSLPSNLDHKGANILKHL